MQGSQDSDWEAQEVAPVLLQLSETLPEKGSGCGGKQGLASQILAMSSSEVGSRERLIQFVMKESGAYTDSSEDSEETSEMLWEESSIQNWESSSEDSAESSGSDY